jgi:hypothetical protein
MPRFVNSLGLSTLDLVLVRREGRAEENYEALLPSLTEITPFLQKTLEEGRKHGVRIKTTGIPPCVLGSTKPYKDKEIYASIVFWDIDGKITEQAKDIKRKFVKFPQCLKCKYYLICCGVLKEYVEIYGQKEFTPQK